MTSDLKALESRVDSQDKRGGEVTYSGYDDEDDDEEDDEVAHSCTIFPCYLGMEINRQSIQRPNMNNNKDCRVGQLTNDEDEDDEDDWSQDYDKRGGDVTCGQGGGNYQGWDCS